MAQASKLSEKTYDPNSKYWHVRVRLLKPQGKAFSCIEFDLTWRDLFNEILKPFLQLDRFKCEGRLVKTFDVDFITYFQTTENKLTLLLKYKDDKTREIRDKAGQFETLADHIGDRNKIEVLSAQYDLKLSFKKRLSLVWMPAIRKHITTVILGIIPSILAAIILAYLGLKEP